MIRIRFQGAEVAKQAVETGLWPLKEAVDGEVTHTCVSKRRPVDAYLKLQARFRHLFEPTRQEDAIRHIQNRVGAYWNHVQGAPDSRREGSDRRKHRRPADARNRFREE